MSLHNRLIILSLHQYEHHKPEMRDVKMSLFSRTFRMVDGKTCMHDFGIVFHIRCPVPCPARHMMEGLTNKSPMFLFQSSILLYTPPSIPVISPLSCMPYAHLYPSSSYNFPAHLVSPIAIRSIW